MATRKVAAAVLAEFDFYACYKCRRLITNPELQHALAGANAGTACPCGSHQVSPVNLQWWQWLLPRVWAFALARLRGLA